MIDYCTYRLSTFQKIVFCSLAFAAALILGWLFYDNILTSLFIFLALQPLQNVYKNYLIEKRKSTLLFQFKDLLYSMSSLMSVGRSIGQALEESIDFWKGTYDEKDYIIIELKYMTGRMSESRESDIAVLEDFAGRTGLEDIKDFVSACRICKETGSNITKAISKTSDIIGDKISLEKELKNIASQKRFEGRIVGLAPFVMIFCVKTISPEYLLPLTCTFEGRIATTVSLVLIVFSWIVIERMNKCDL